MAGEGFHTEQPGDPGAHDPGRAAREAADRIAEQVRDILGTAEHRAADIRSRAERDADAIREDAAGAAARLLKRLDMLESDLERNLIDFFDTVRREVEGLATRQAIEEATRRQEAEEQGFGQERPFEEAPPEPEADTTLDGEPEPPAEPGADSEPRRRRGLIWGRRPREDEQAAAPAEEPGGAEDAHVTALNMALNGTPREETESFLVERFGQIHDLDSILDDVYGRVKRR
jgi:hypothetical protein